MKYTIIIIMSLIVPGCSALHTYLTPPQVTNVISVGKSISDSSKENPPQGEDLKEYLDANAELWNELYEWYELGN